MLALKVETLVEFKNTFSNSNKITSVPQVRKKKVVEFGVYEH
jgi:hypothetical protein